MSVFVQDPILDPNKTTKVQNLIFLMANTQLGYTDNVLAYQNQYLTPSQSPKNHFIAPHCTLQNHTSEIAKLKQVIESLTESITQLKAASAQPITLQGNSNNQTPPQAAVSQHPTESQERSEPRKQVTSDHQKFNVVMHRPTRLDHDLTSITHAFS